MPDLLDFLERAMTGPIMTQQDFQINILMPNIRSVLEEFQIAYDPKDPVPSDDALADRLYGAAIEFLSRTGLYCEGTNRVIQFDKDELTEGMKSYRVPGTFGEGRDRSSLRPRKPGDTSPPFCHIGVGTVATTEEIAMAQVEGYAGVAQANSISIPALATVRGLQVQGGSPLEIYAVFNAISAARKALRRAGRPGLPILNLCSTATTAAGTIAGCYPDAGARTSDGWLIDFIAEMSVDFNNLNKLAFVTHMGGNIGSTDITIFGGYAGGPPGTALVMTSYHIAGGVMMKGTYHLAGNVNMNLGCSSTRACLWVSAIAGRATSRNDRYCAIALPYAVGGPCSKTYFYEAVAQQFAAVTSGYAGIQMSHPAKAVVNDAATPTEARFNADIAYSIARSGMAAGRASELCNKLLEKYEKELKKPFSGDDVKTYPELYDLKTGKRSEIYDQLYGEVLEDLDAMGIPLD